MAENAPVGFQSALERRAQVEEFRQKHKTAMLTLVFTDTVGSTALKQELGDLEAVKLIYEHHALVREVLKPFTDAVEISTSGDSFFLLFLRPSDATKFALILQARLRERVRAGGRNLSDRIGIHVGEVVVEESKDHKQQPQDLYGIQVDTCARVMSLARGDQILLTRCAFDNARQVLKGQDVREIGPINWMNHGPYLLKGVEEALDICEVGETGKAVLLPPPDGEKARRQVSADGEPVLGWRPALDQIVPGTKWVLTKKLGEGGFGEVWLGKHETLKENRVFKFCFRADRVRSLKREVTIFRMLKEHVGNHPNIVSVQEVYFDQPPYYIMMSYAEGEDLKAWTERQGGVAKIPEATRWEIVAQVADALHAAHIAGVIHRDVKPGNILVSSPSIAPEMLNVKLTDFGIGQVLAQEFLAGITRAGFTMTVSGDQYSAMSGTQMFMAPELLAGKGASKQSDIYSLGVVFYQLAVGDLNRPVTMDWAKDIHNIAVRDDLSKCFAGDPKDRFVTAGQMAERLRTLAARQAEIDKLHATQEAIIRKQHFIRLTAVTSAGLLLACAAAWYWNSYNRTYTNFYANVVRRWGVLQGVVPVKDTQFAKRMTTYRVFQRGSRGKVYRVELVNSSLTLAPWRYTEPVSVGLSKGDSAWKERIWKFEFDSAGHLKSEIAFDGQDNLLARFDSQTVTPDGREMLLMSMSGSGLADIRASSGAAAMRVKRTGDGLDESVRYLSAGGQPTPDDKGAYGKNMTYDGAGNMIEMTFVDKADKPFAHPIGYARLTRRYDALGNWIEEAYYDEAGNPTRDVKQGVARVARKYDTIGNLVEVGFFDEAGRPMPGRQGFSKEQHKYDDHGTETEVKFCDEQGQPLQTRVVITKITPDSQADSIGLEVGDAILSYNGKEIRTQAGFSTRAPGTGDRELVILRDGIKQVYSVRPGPLGVFCEDRVVPTVPAADSPFKPAP